MSSLERIVCNVLLLVGFFYQQIAKDTVNDLLQYAFERPECCYRTCLAVYFKGKRIDNFVELGTVEGLVSGCTMELVEGSRKTRPTSLHLFLNYVFSLLFLSSICSEGHPDTCPASAGATRL